MTLPGFHAHFQMEFGVFSSEPNQPSKRARSNRAQSGRSTSKSVNNEDLNNENIPQQDTNDRHISGGSILISIVENRAREICIAKINTESVSDTIIIYF